MQSCNFDCLYEFNFINTYGDDIHEDDKVYIHAVTTRLRRILDWNPNENIELYNRESGIQILRELLSRFHAWKEYINQTESLDVQRIQHLVIFSLARLSLYYWIEDSTIVAEILTELYECDGHFSSIFAHIVNNDMRSLLRPPNITRQREDTATIFFLHHTQKAKLQFHEVRFLDLLLRFPLAVPAVFLAVVYTKPHILLHLLQFGARVDFPASIMTDEWNLPMLLRHLIRVLWNFLGELEQYADDYLPLTPYMTNTTHQTADCLRILLRVIPQIRYGEINFLLMKFERNVLSGTVWSHDYIRQLSESNIVPTFVNRYLEPSELQHLCRCSIRNALNSAWNLPYGIAVLPLPKRLKDYLSLASD